jgi:hypothetical protein
VSCWRRFPAAWSASVKVFASTRTGCAGNGGCQGILGAGLISSLADQLAGFAFGGCDGLVAAEAISYRSGRDVRTQIASHGTGTPRKFETSTRNLRSDYPSGCHDSIYIVFTSITES